MTIPPRDHLVLSIRSQLTPLFLLASLAGTVGAQCNFSLLTQGSGPTSANGAVQASTRWDPDGAGPIPPRVVFAGSFTVIGSVGANRIAALDPTTNTWSTLGSGLTLTSNPVETQVTALATLPNGDLVAAGRFTSAGGTAAAHVARWDGTTWHALGSGLSFPSEPFNIDVFSLAALPNGDLVAGGRFTHAGGIQVDSLARWDGTNWHTMGGVKLLSSWGEVHSLLTLPNGDLVVGGQFNTVNATPADGIARWNGSWSTFPAPATPFHYAMRLAVGPTGSIYGWWRAGSVGYTNGLYEWDGATWTARGSFTGVGATPALVTALHARANGEVLASGYFASVAGVPANSAARWNGTTWSAMGTGLVGSTTIPNGLTWCELGNGFVALGGSFVTAGGIGPNLAHWTGAAFGTLPSFVVNGETRAALPDPNGGVYVGGTFTTVSGVPANRVARWNGAAWQALGSGITGSQYSGPAVVRAMAWLPDGSLVVAGRFAQAGSVPTNNIARWNGTTWSTLGGGIGNTFNDGVYALAVMPNGDLIAAGVFVHVGSPHITRWDGANWHPMGAGFFSPAYALAVLPNGQLIAGGDLYDGVRYWNDPWWTPVGNPLYPANNGFVRALTVLADGSLLATGTFQAPTGTSSPNLARWDGSNWSGVGNGLPVQGSALAALPDGNFVVGGTNLVAHWRGGAFSTLDTSMSPTVLAVQTDGTLVTGSTAALRRHAPGCRATATPTGPACNGTTGPLILTATALPWIASTARFHCTNVPDGDLAVGLLGLSSPGQPLSLAHPLGSAACTQWASDEVTVFVSPSGGAVDWPIPIPGSSTLIGITLHQQVLQAAFDPLAGLLGVYGSNGLTWEIGAF